MLTMSPQARAITAFAVSFALLAGYLNRISFAVTLVFANALPSGRAGVAIAGLLLIAVAAATLWFTTVTLGQQTAGWELHLAQAAVALAALGTTVAVLTTIGAVAHGDGSLPAGLLGGGLYTG
jgi:hypothetical protein